MPSSRERTDPAGISTRRKWLGRAVWLAVATVAYNLAEAGVALYAGVQAGSIALVGFGLDSVIELSAAAVVLWRLRLEARGAEFELVRGVESGVTRFVGVTLLALAAYVIIQSVWILWTRQAPQESWLGVVLAILSLLIMPLLGIGKLRAADELGSRALRQEAKETLACAYLSFALLLGLGANAIAGWWWADPAAALLMVPWLLREGLEALEGDEDEEDEGNPSR
jgi:divalent metal cation (Fe/Co/Zn/Cd) transporter